MIVNHDPMNKSVFIFCLFLAASATILFMNRKEAPKKTWTGFSPTPGLPLSKVEWIDTVIKLGKVIEGDSIPVIFRFKNTGNNRLIVSGVAASCGCTLPQKPEKPVEAGNEGIIKAFFRTKGNLGYQRKKLMVYMNTEQGNYDLPFDIEVIKK